MSRDDGIDITDAGEYLNISFDGQLRISISESENEVLVYENGMAEPVGKYELEEGVPMADNL